MRGVTILFASLLVLAACGEEKSPDETGQATGGIVGQWQLGGGTLDGDPFPIVDGYRVTITFDEDGTFGGTAACNGYGGGYRHEDGVLVIDEWSITEMGCEPDVMASEQAFMIVLLQPVDIARDGDVLTMQGEGIDLTFSAVPSIETAELIGTFWELDTLFDGEVASSVRGDGFLRLESDGTFEGSTGCRDVSGTYVINGDEIRMTQMTATGDCPAELADQDSFVIGVLESPRAEIEGQRLRLWTAGDEGLGYHPSER